MPALIRYQIGKDFTEEQYNKWLEQLTWWVGSRMPNVDNPREYSQKVILAGLNGTKIDGSTWPAVTNNFFKRIKQIAGFDLELGIPVREPTKHRAPNSIHRTDKTEEDDLPPINLKDAMGMRTGYINDLLKKYPHLDSPVYKPKVEELAETIVKSRMISTDFLTANGKTLETLSKIRESLHKQIGELMTFLEISPKQRVTKTLEAKNADVGSLVAKLEAYGEVWQEYETLDALRELIQIYHMLKSKRPDGSPQLNDWEIWHMTRSKPIHFKCRCGENYELLAGFTAQEIEQALLQAKDVYGFGLEDISQAAKPTDGVSTLDTVAATNDFDGIDAMPINENDDPNTDV